MITRMRPFEELTLADASPDWDKVNRVSKQETLYKNEVREALIEAANDPNFNDLRDRPVISSIEVGPEFIDEPESSIQEAINSVKRKFLRELEMGELISKLDFKTKYDQVSQEHFLIAEFSFTPSRIVSELPKLTDHRKSSPIKKKLARLQERHFPHTLPRGVLWRNVSITFKNQENVTIKVHGYTHETDFGKMGFKGRGVCPSKQWLLLLLLAQNAGELTWQTVGADFKSKKRLELLNKGLKKYFKNIDGDPFSGYRTHQGYRSKLILVPPPVSDIGIENGKPVTTENEESYYDQAMEDIP